MTAAVSRTLGRFDPARTVDLDESVRRDFLHALALGAALGRGVRLRLRGHPSALTGAWGHGTPDWAPFCEAEVTDFAIVD